MNAYVVPKSSFILMLSFFLQSDLPIGEILHRDVLGLSQEICLFATT